MGRTEKEDHLVSVSTIEVASISDMGEAPRLDREDEPKYNVFKQPRLWWNQNYLSWRFYVTIYAGLALLTTFIVLIGLVIAIAVHGVDRQGRITLFEGSCSSAKTKNFFAHLFISGLGTYMLSASAYVMYCLTPPSREEIDKQHAKGRWVDIGAMSFRNLRVISKKRVTFFILLGVTSPILQFFFNAFLFPTYNANAYTAFIAQETFTTSNNISINLPKDIFHTHADETNHSFTNAARWLHGQYQEGKLERLSNTDCIAKYAVPILSDRKNVIVVTESDKKRSADIFDAFEASIPTKNSQKDPEQFAWLCSVLQIASKDQCLFHVEHLRRNATNWITSDGAKVKYCLSQKTTEHCKLQFNLTLSLVVLFTCLFKSLIMFAVAFFTYETPLMTTGDAIASFMRRPDPHTKNMCLASKRFIQNHPGHWRSSAPAYFKHQPKRWHYAIKSRLFTCILLMVLGTCFAASLYCTLQETISLRNLLHLGIGTMNRRFFLGWHRKDTAGMVRSVFFANEGHALFGILYVLYNNVFYTMIFQDEWSRFFSHRKGLRVSESPRGKQRTVYFFLMPYRYAIPIMGFSCIIHTFISQTVFLVDVEAWGHGIEEGVENHFFTRDQQFDFTSTGFSPLANAGLLLSSIAMILYLVVLSTRKFKSGMPVVSTCSAAISAACHPDPTEEPESWLKEIQWGVTEVKDGSGHCTFSAKDVSPPSERVPYK